MQGIALPWWQAGGGEARSPLLRPIYEARAVSLQLMLGAGDAGRGFEGVVVSSRYVANEQGLYK